MRRRDVMAAGAAAILIACLLPVPAGAAAQAAPAGAGHAAALWGRAIPVPGLGELNKGRSAVVSVSCASAGNCAAGGEYQSHGRHGFVVSEQDGRWRRAMEVPGLAALAAGGSARVYEVSCASAGNCAAGGEYWDGESHRHGFVVSQKNGHWHQAIEVPGLAALAAGGNAGVFSVSCGSAGNCVAGGFYRNRGVRGFVVTEKSGRWRQAIEVPGLAALNQGHHALVSSVACASAGDCAAGGMYTDASGGGRAFVISEKNGGWETAQRIAGNLNPGGGASVYTVSCASAGDCSAGGQYQDASDNLQAFVISQADGTWGAAREVAADLNSNGLASVTSVSCAAAGSCSAGGTYDYGGYNWGFVVSERNGIWGQAISMPHGLGFRDAGVSSVSCGSAGNCAVGGHYEIFDENTGSQGFVANGKNGAWGKGTTVPGLAALNKGDYTDVSSVSCAAAASCAAGGYYAESGRHAHVQGFVTQRAR